jgi:ribosomal protein S18 acetylase RimI-like enzyme
MKISQDGGVEVRIASQGDLDALVDFSAAMAIETEGRRLDHDRLRRGVLAVLESTRHGFYLVGERQNPGSRSVIGQLLVTYEWSDWRNATFWWIQSVYVDTTCRRQGVYRRMHGHVVNMARARKDVCGIRLYVEEHNETAQQVYRRVGLMPAGYLVFEEDFVLSKDGVRQQGGPHGCEDSRTVP